MNEKNKYPPAETLLNFGIVFRGSIEDFEQIKAQLLRRGAALIYQTKSVDKIRVTREVKPIE